MPDERGIPVEDWTQWPVNDHAEYLDRDAPSYRDEDPPPPAEGGREATEPIRLRPAAERRERLREFVETTGYIDPADGTPFETNGLPGLDAWDEDEDPPAGAR